MGELYPVLSCFSGADLAALVREASVQTLKEFMKSRSDENSTQLEIQVTLQHFEQALLKVRPSVSKEVKQSFCIHQFRLT